MTELLTRIFIKDRNNVKCKKVRENYGMLGSVTGIICNIILCIIKIAAGTVTGSISITADGLNNLSDMGSSVITLIGFKLSNKPADSDHPFGHGRFEYISAFIVSVLILFVGGELLISSVKTLFSGEKAPEYPLVSFIILAVSVAVKFWMFLFNKKLGKKIDSSALLATAKDSLGDAAATTAILVAAAVSSAFKLPFNLDAVMAIGVALFILWAGISSAKETLDEILGGPPEKELIDEIEQTIMSFEGFLGIHDLIVHNYGPGRQFASVHVEVPQDVDIVECHEKIDLCEKVVNEKTGILLTVHMDPVDSNNETVAATKELINGIVKDISEQLSIHDFRMTPKAQNRTNLIFDVVVPPKFPKKPSELQKEIADRAKQHDKSFECVITFDNSYV